MKMSIQSVNFKYDTAILVIKFRYVDTRQSESTLDVLEFEGTNQIR